MNSHHPTQTYFRPRASSSFGQQLYQQKVLGYKKLWPAIWNMLLVLCSILLAVNLCLTHIITNLEQAVQTVENVRHEFTEIQISLRAKKEQLYSPEHVLMLASQKLSLNVPDKEQVKAFKVYK